MRQKWMQVLVLELVLFGLFATLWAITITQGWPSGVLVILLIVGCLALLLPFVVVQAILPARQARRVQFIRQNGLAAMAEPLIEAEPLAAAAMKGVQQYQGPEIFLAVPVRIQPGNGTPPYETTMQASLFFAHFLRPGVRVTVKIDPQNPQFVVLDDTMQDIVQRNPSLRRE